MPAELYELRIIVEGAASPIWRKVAIPAAMRLRRLHEVIEACLGWAGSSSYCFKQDGRLFGISHPRIAIRAKSTRARRNPAQNTLH